ncbi:hypothetical protein Hamer_G024738 [Homarus americanus]|uniref:Secreted protein n=1 Tax=Homarus americanus TaxID=6706 RepID=A0A8J5JDD0_HOMAM|nr:hypothetical protein Hamer_G024738 [Homarus americanus]
MVVVVVVVWWWCLVMVVEMKRASERASAKNKKVVQVWREAKLNSRWRRRKGRKGEDVKKECEEKKQRQEFEEKTN